VSTLPVKKGVDGIPSSAIPDSPTAFVSWFKNSFLPRWAAHADTRNAVAGAGVLIAGSLSTPATISVSTEVQALFAQPYMLVGAPVAPAVLTGYRSVAAQVGVVSLTDGGAGSTITLGIANNGIGNAQLRQGTAASVVGNATSVLANVADIVALTDNTALVRVSGTLTFSALPLSAIAPTSNNTVLGNISGSLAAPIALNQAQITSLVGLASASASGAVPAIPSVANEFLNGNNAWAQVAIGSLANIANNTVVGNVSGGSAAPAALSTTQLTALINEATTSLTGAIPALSGTSTQYLNGVGAWATQVTSLVGTANQIAVSASTGAVTLSLPQNVIIPTPASGTALTVNALTGTNSFVLTGALSGSSVQGNYTNTSNTANSAAVQVLSIAGTSALSAHVLFDIAGVQDWYAGVKGSTSTWSVGTGGTVGGADKLSITTAGNVTIAAPSNGQTLAMTGIGAGTAALTVNTSATTGSKTASMTASNKPGTNNQTTPATWLPIICDGATYYSPLYAA
jgi:hypothetical protein